MLNRSRMQAIIFSNLELKMLFWLWCLWLVFYSYQVVALKEAVRTEVRAPHRDGNNNPRLHATPFSFKMVVFKIFRGELSATDL
jgi:hypothetical protein